MANRRRRHKSKSSETYRNYIAKGQILLRKLLEKKGFSNEIIKAVLDSGYLAMKADTVLAPGSMHIVDGFYGSKTMWGLIPLGFFSNYLRQPLDKYVFPKMSRHYKVSSLQDAKARLLDDPNAPFYLAGEMAFRGQTNKYSIKRQIPNPMARDIDGSEELILASYWRQFLPSIIDRTRSLKSNTIDAFFSDPILRKNIPDNIMNTIDQFDSGGYRLIDEYNVWSHTDDLTLAEKFTDNVMPRTGYVRYSREGRLFRQLPTIQQHYGIRTAGLDVTFDLSVACFFALNSFSFNENGKGYFQRKNKDVNPVVYCFVFHDPPLTKTLDITSSFDWFKDFEPLRPKRQNCALVGTDSFSVNVAQADMAVILELDLDFDTSGLPDQNYLFPSASEDPFYSYLLEKKKTDPLWSEIIEYQDFH